MTMGISSVEGAPMVASTGYLQLPPVSIQQPTPWHPLESIFVTHGNNFNKWTCVWCFGRRLVCVFCPLSLSLDIEIKTRAGAYRYGLFDDRRSGIGDCHISSEVAWLNTTVCQETKPQMDHFVIFFRRIKNLRIDPNDDSLARVGSGLEADSPGYNIHDLNTLDYSIAEQWPLPMGVSTEFPTNTKTRIKYLWSDQPRYHSNNHGGRSRERFQLLLRRCSRGKWSHVRNDWFRWCWNFENRCVHCWFRIDTTHLPRTRKTGIWSRARFPIVPFEPSNVS